MSTTVLPMALRYLRGGLSVVPIIANGEKRPSQSWKIYQSRQPTETEVRRWFGGEALLGVAVIGGTVSGNLEILDFDTNEAWERWSVQVEERYPRLLDGFPVVRTPGGGRHLYYRLPYEPDGNRKLARDSEGVTLIETRGEGGYCLAPGCPPQCHPTRGTYEHVSGPPLEEIPYFDNLAHMDAYDVWLDLALALNEYVEDELPPEQREYQERQPTDGLSPGDDWSERGDWQDLEDASWTRVRTSGGVTFWRRPGKQHGWSATTGHCKNRRGHDLFYVFTSSAPPFEPERCYTKFAVRAMLRHNKDYAAAASALRGEGYGAPLAGVVRPDYSIYVSENEPVGDACEDEVPQLQPRPLVESCFHDELLRMEFPPLPWIIQDVIPDEGMSFLGGKKKLGKSWLALQIAQAVAQGVPVLDKKTAQGSVIYLCLEDGRRRIQDRLRKQKTVEGLPITYITRFPALDEKVGIEHFRALLDGQRPKLVIIDTLAAAKSGKSEENAARDMAVLGNFLRECGQYYRCGIIVIHHHGKLTIGNPGDDLRGSSALAAAADINLGLYREQGRHVLRGEGRDIKEFDLGLTFDPVDTWTWQVCQDQAEALREDADRAVFDALHALGEADTEAVATYLGKGKRSTADRLRRLRSEGEVQCRPDHTGERGQPRILWSRTPHLNGEADDAPLFTVE